MRRILATILALGILTSPVGAQDTLACLPGSPVPLAGSGAAPGTSLLIRFAGRVVGGGVADAGGAYRLTLAMGRERPGDHPVQVEERDGGRVVYRAVCTIPGATTTTRPPAASSTPTTTPTAEPTPGATPTSPPVTRPVADFDRNGDARVTCADFDTQAQAGPALEAGYVNLDEDRDGVPCEALPRG